MTTKYSIRNIAKSLNHDEIKNIIIRYGDVFQEPVNISHNNFTNCKTLRTILKDFGYDGQLDYKSIMNWLDEIQNEVIDAIIDDKDKEEFTLEPQRDDSVFVDETEEIEKLRAEIDKINKIEVEIQNKKKELIKELNSKLSPLPPLPHFKIPKLLSIVNYHRYHHYHISRFQNFN